jgi:hypothetical protein
MTTLNSITSETTYIFEGNCAARTYAAMPHEKYSQIVLRDEMILDIIHVGDDYLVCRLTANHSDFELEVIKDYVEAGHLRINEELSKWDVKFTSYDPEAGDAEYIVQVIANSPAQAKEKANMYYTVKEFITVVQTPARGNDVFADDFPF